MILESVSKYEFGRQYKRHETNNLIEMKWSLATLNTGHLNGVYARSNRQN